MSGIDGWAYWLLWGNQHGVPSSASNEDLFRYYDYVQAGGKLTYQQWYDNRYNVPIGDPLIPMLIIVSVYLIYAKMSYNMPKKNILINLLPKKSSKDPI